MYQALCNLVGNIGVYYLLQGAVLLKTSFSSRINIPLWEVCRNGERMRNKSEGSSLPVLSSPGLACVRRGGRCSHTPQIQSSWFIPSSASGFLALLSKYIFGRNPARQGDVRFVPCLASRAGCGFHRRLPAPLGRHRERPRTSPRWQPLTPLAGPAASAWFRGDLSRGALNDNVIAASADSPRNS